MLRCDCLIGNTKKISKHHKRGSQFGIYYSSNGAYIYHAPWINNESNELSGELLPACPHAANQTDNRKEDKRKKQERWKLRTITDDNLEEAL